MDATAAEVVLDRIDMIATLRACPTHAPPITSQVRWVGERPVDPAAHTAAVALVVRMRGLVHSGVLTLRTCIGCARRWYSTRPDAARCEQCR